MSSSSYENGRGCGNTFSQHVSGCGLGSGTRHPRLTMRYRSGTTRLPSALGRRAVLTLVSLHNAKVFRLLLKTSVERNTNELNLFLSGSAVRPSLVLLWKEQKTVLGLVRWATADWKKCKWDESDGFYTIYPIKVFALWEKKLRRK